MTRRFFITGTDTNVGKTIASAVLVARSLQIFSTVGFHKPIQTGAEKDSDPATVLSLTNLSPEAATTGIALNRPLSPHLSAHYANTYLEFGPLVTRTHAACIHDCDFVEGAGGVLVPLNRREFMIDLMHALAMPCIVVTAAKLGCINHTLLTLEALRARRIPIHGVIMMGDRVRDNEDSIKFYGNVENLLHVPKLASLTKEDLSSAVKKHAASIDRFLLG